MNIYADLCSDFWSGYAIPNPIICVIFLTRRRGPYTPVGPCALHYVHNRLNQLVQKKCRFRLDRSTLFIAKSNTQRSAKVNVKRAVQLYTDMRMKTRSADQRRQSLVEVPLCVVGNRLSLLGFLTSLRLFSLDDHFSVLRNSLHARTHAHTHTHTHTQHTLQHSSKHLSVLPTVVFHPCCRHDIQTTAAVFYFTSSGRSARISVYSRQAGFSGFWCHRL